MTIVFGYILKCLLEMTLVGIVMGGAYEIDESLFPEVKWEDKEPKVLTIADNTFIKIEDRLSNNNNEE